SSTTTSSIGWTRRPAAGESGEWARTTCRRATRIRPPVITSSNPRWTTLRTMAPVRNVAWLSTMTARRRAWVLAFSAVSIAAGAGAAHAQFMLGQQRAGTSWGAFLNIDILPEVRYARGWTDEPVVGVVGT